jgi:hypothetical protein
MIGALLLAFHLGSALPLGPLPTYKPSCGAQTQWATADLRQLGVVAGREGSITPARCRRAEHLRRLRRALIEGLDQDHS